MIFMFIKFMREGNGRQQILYPEDEDLTYSWIIIST